ncbi:MAG: DNA (cytosine-5-)-methyltransferase [Candidatus Levybacteria bacterium RIFCSPHIGHO2_01_FULL_37_33]|nr:MAG: DNA (cytosine-5-)-methyltransferase [Candidatus Levybacteria bacterium RIFCSPHIGHO2_01_FULL_37_33]OGH17121.1 MAG: DNA (cytosine-5-)-methyltransferase [Candidatus Levybacteria bacterium RIFCSPHIGHO2_02_FULL_37_11]OGH29837.1 MAG: DNA (cytosine-5-)-methyltransferase [Candidatus Levybacteria bacterium RIFCSPHIGHO2_12_FULL_37_12]OGH32895.1 MAG: DNA (cytosine-5-)-methyltransferase [Candidatus Levybacteria bacterium RIFCSPLOWO2_01_FULL_36_54]
MDKNKVKLSFIDLFSGAGGMTLGFENAGFKNMFSIDNDIFSCDTYSSNFPMHVLLRKDIGELEKKEILHLVGGKKVDVVIGGPPCQGFSIAGRIGRRFVDDPRNHLFKEFSRVVGIVKPKILVMENVARLYSHNKGKTKQEIVNEFEKIGYKIDVKILHSEAYGVPQKRSRVFFIGNRLGVENLFPEPRVKEYISIEKAIGDLPKLKSGQSSLIPNHESMNHTAQMLFKMSYVPEGGSKQSIPSRFRPLGGDVRKYIRYKKNEPSYCVTGDMRKIFHYNQNRALTVRELARIQTYPDKFIFLGNKISQQQQVGNSIPPLLAFFVAKEIAKML